MELEADRSESILSHNGFLDILHSNAANHALDQGSRRIEVRGLCKEFFKMSLLFKLSL